MPYTLAQSTAAQSSQAARAISFANANGPGSLLTLAIGSASTVGGAGVVDSAGNTWLRQAKAVNGGNACAEQWYAVNAVQATNTVTVTSQEPGTILYFSLQEWSGGSTAAVVAGGSTQTASGSAFDYGPVPYTQSAGVSVLTLATQSAFDITVEPTGYTALQTPLARLQTWYRTLTSSGSESVSVNSSAFEVAAFTMTVFGDPDSTVSVGTRSLRSRGLLLRGVS